MGKNPGYRNGVCTCIRQLLLSNFKKLEDFCSLLRISELYLGRHKYWSQPDMDHFQEVKIVYPEFCPFWYLFVALHFLRNLCKFFLQLKVQFHFHFGKLGRYILGICQHSMAKILCQCKVTKEFIRLNTVKNTSCNKV